MKIAIFSDIHGNKEALKSIIEDIKINKYDDIICLGDVIGIGPKPKECLDLIINNNIKMVLGNHELYLLKGPQIFNVTDKQEIRHHAWVKEQITENQKDYLKHCELTIEEEYHNKKVLFEHFLINYNSKSEYPFYDTSIVKDESIKNIMHTLKEDLVFIGHEHNAFSIDHKLYDVGSSGCVKDNYTKYTVLDTDSLIIETINISYNREDFKQDLLKNEYPARNEIAPWFFGIKI